MTLKISEISGKTVHFIGIGGSGMTPLALISKQLGMVVSGSDLSDSKNIQALKKQKILIHTSHKEKNIVPNSYVVFSSAIKEDNIEWQTAKKRNCSLFHRSDFLSIVIKAFKSIVVSGTHGKTTTSSLLTHLLVKMNLDPSSYIGGHLLEFDTSYFLGKGEFFIAEADESDGTFLKYQSFINILTNIDKDHLDFYGSFENLKTAFLKFCSNKSESGTTIIGIDSEASFNLWQSLRKQDKTISFGYHNDSEIKLLDYSSSKENMNYTVDVFGKKYKGSIPLIGLYNLQNLLPCFALASLQNWDIEKTINIMSNFKGVKRRMNLVGCSQNTYLYDDYAHNPGKIKSCVNGIKNAFKNHELLVVFQPHRYSRLETMYTETIESFKEADQVFVIPVYAAGEKINHDFSPQSIARDIAKAGKIKTDGFKNVDDLIDHLNSNYKEINKVIITIGAGDVWKVAHRLDELIKNE